MVVMIVVMMMVMVMTMVMTMVMIVVVMMMMVMMMMMTMVMTMVMIMMVVVVVVVMVVMMMVIVMLVIVRVLVVIENLICTYFTSMLCLKVYMINISQYLMIFISIFQMWTNASHCLVRTMGAVLMESIPTHVNVPQDLRVKTAK